jgi:cathepsin L
VTRVGKYALTDSLAMFQQAQFNKTYTGNLENARRTAWEQNLVEIYKHNLMAAAGHHSYTLRDNHIADLSTRRYNQEMVSNGDASAREFAPRYLDHQSPRFHQSVSSRGR